MLFRYVDISAKFPYYPHLAKQTGEKLKYVSKKQLAHGLVVPGIPPPGNLKNKDPPPL